MNNLCAMIEQAPHFCPVLFKRASIDIICLRQTTSETACLQGGNLPVTTLQKSLTRNLSASPVLRYMRVLAHFEIQLGRESSRPEFLEAPDSKSLGALY